MLAISYSRNSCDLLIAHPPCTYIARVSAPWLARDVSRLGKLQDAVELFYFFLTFPAEFVCVENPYPLAQAQLPRWTQKIEPYQFGHPYLKATCLWLRGLPPLQTTDVKTEVYTIPERILAGSKSKPNGYNPHSWTMLHNGKERATKRARTFPGIAAAMAAQWGNLKQPYGFFP